MVVLHGNFGREAKKTDLGVEARILPFCILTLRQQAALDSIYSAAILELVTTSPRDDKSYSLRYIYCATGAYNYNFIDTKIQLALMELIRVGIGEIVIPPNYRWEKYRFRLKADFRVGRKAEALQQQLAKYVS